MIKEAIILAGGLGERLRNVIGDLPKPMAEIDGKPFLTYLLEYLITQQIEKVILSVGYNFRVIQDYFKDRYKTLKISYSVEKKLLGTGGAVKKAIALTESSDIIVLNGDTYFNINLHRLYQFHLAKNSLLTIAIKHIENNHRYGSVVIDETGRIIGFKEKSANYKLINGGINILDRLRFMSFILEDKFSFEKDFLEKFYADCSFYGLEFEDYFIDIGIPEDFEKAKQEIVRFTGK